MSIRALASETAIYGLSSILGRGLYFLLTPLYTSFFLPFEMGVQTYIFSFTGFLMVLATLRLDVAYFRKYSSTEDERQLFGTAWLTTALSGGVLGGLLMVLSPVLADAFGFPAYRWLFAIAGGILMFDAMTELPLARLRMERRPWRFAFVRLSGIIVNLSLNLFWLYLLPKWPSAPSWLATPTAGIGYIFLANLVSSGLTFMLLAPELRGIKWRIDSSTIRELLSFSAPLIVVGFSFIINELIDRQLLPVLWPGGRAEGLSLAGVYSQNYKLAMLLALFTQAFRYGAEPFFFRESGKADAQDNYARLARYFLLAALLGALTVCLLLPAFSQLILRDEAYRIGSDVVPVLLAANLCLGMYYNFSVWYKVTDATRFGAYISVGGAVLTIVLNVLLIPRYGFYGCAWATLICYGSMMVASYVIGQRRYPIPYPTKMMLGYTTIGGLILLLFWQLSPKLVGKSVLDLTVSGGTTVEWMWSVGFGAALLLAFLSLVVVVERRALGR